VLDRAQYLKYVSESASALFFPSVQLQPFRQVEGLDRTVESPCFEFHALGECPLGEVCSESHSAFVSAGRARLFVDENRQRLHQMIRHRGVEATKHRWWFGLVGAGRVPCSAGPPPREGGLPPPPPPPPLPPRPPPSSQLRLGHQHSQDAAQPPPPSAPFLPQTPFGISSSAVPPVCQPFRVPMVVVPGLAWGGATPFCFSLPGPLNVHPAYPPFQPHAFYHGHFGDDFRYGQCPPPRVGGSAVTGAQGRDGLVSPESGSNAFFRGAEKAVERLCHHRDCDPRQSRCDVFDRCESTKRQRCRSRSRSRTRD